MSHRYCALPTRNKVRLNVSKGPGYVWKGLRDV